MYSSPTHAGTPLTPSQNIVPRADGDAAGHVFRTVIEQFVEQQHPAHVRQDGGDRQSPVWSHRATGLTVDLQRVAVLEVHEPAAAAPRVFTAVVRFRNQLIAATQAADARPPVRSIASRLAHRLLEARERPEDELQIREQAFGHELPGIAGAVSDCTALPS